MLRGSENKVEDPGSKLKTRRIESRRLRAAALLRRTKDSSEYEIGASYTK